MLFDNTPKGWQCPVCGRVYAPFVLVCYSDHSQIQYTTSSTDVKYQHKENKNTIKDKK